MSLGLQVEGKDAAKPGSVAAPSGGATAGGFGADLGGAAGGAGFGGNVYRYATPSSATAPAGPGADAAAKAKDDVNGLAYKPTTETWAMKTTENAPNFSLQDSAGQKGGGGGAGVTLFSDNRGYATVTGGGDKPAEPGQVVGGRDLAERLTEAVPQQQKQMQLRSSSSSRTFSSRRC